jgi:hypothetical protein
MYVDGTLEMSEARQYGTSALGAGSLGSNLPQHGFKGNLDEFMVFDRALAAAEVQALFQSQK